MEASIGLRKSVRACRGIGYRIIERQGNGEAVVNRAFKVLAVKGGEAWMEAERDEEGRGQGLFGLRRYLCTTTYR